MMAVVPPCHLSGKYLVVLVVKPSHLVPPCSVPHRGPLSGPGPGEEHRSLRDAGSTSAPQHPSG